MNAPDKCQNCDGASDTPRTDALLDPEWLERGLAQNGRSWGWGTLTDARDLCRQLERERDQLLARVKRLEKAGDAMAGAEWTEEDLVIEWIKAKEDQP